MGHGGHYITSNVAGKRDLYNFEDISSTNTIYAVNQVAIAKSEQTPNSLKLGMSLTTGGTNYIADVGTPTSQKYQQMSYIRTLNPKTSAAWTMSDINGLEAGIITIS